MTNTLENQLKNWIDQGRKYVEDMQAQMAEGKMNAADAFEKQKAFLKTSINTWKEHIDKTTDAAEESATKMKAKLDELMIQLNLGKAEGQEQFEEQKKKIETALQEAYETAKKTYNNNHDKLVRLFESHAQAYKTGIEISQLQFTLAKMQGKENWEKTSKEISQKMKELLTHYTYMQKSAIENMEEWNNQIVEGFHKMQNWLKDFVKPK